MTKKEKQDENPFYDSKIQKILNKLISEEIIANNFYTGCVAAACKCQGALIQDMFSEIAEDELNDHCKKMIEWAKANDYSVPYKYSDYEKFAIKSSSQQLEKLKDNQDAIYYVLEALKSEEDAIKSYQEAMEYENVPQDLNAILLQNYYDELEHHENLSTLKMAIEGQVDLINW